MPTRIRSLPCCSKMTNASASPTAEPDEDPPIRLGVFGGTFDPPHVGHVSLARELQESRALDEILWIPVGVPPHKSVNPLTSPKLRMEMVCAAIDGCGHQSVSDIELLREGPFLHGRYTQGTPLGVPLRSHRFSSWARISSLSWQGGTRLRKSFALRTCACCPAVASSSLRFCLASA